MILFRSVFAIILLWVSALNCAAGNPIWRWANPIPHGANIYAIATRGSAVVQVGEFGHAYTSDDLDQWRPLQTGVQNTLRAAVWFGSRLIITGSEGTILFSDDLNKFITIDLGTSDWIEGIAASNSRLVAVGDNGAIYTSSDGAGWQRLPDAADWLRSVAYANGRFVAVGDAGFVITSVDGLQWTAGARLTTKDLNRVVWTGDRFWILGNGGAVYRSSNGSNWSSVYVGTSNDLFDAASDGSINVIVGRSELRTSPTGLDLWTSQTGPSPKPPDWTYYVAHWDGAEFLVGGRSGALAEGFKAEGSATTQWFASTDSPRNWIWGLIRIDGLYVACGEGGGIFTSVDGYRFDQEVVPEAFETEILEGIGGTTNILVAVGTAGTILWSPGGRTNVVTTNPASEKITNEVSLLGLEWNAVSPRPTANELQGVAAFGSAPTFIVTGGNGTILTSTDGKIWSPRVSGSTWMLSSVATSPSRAVAVGDHGTVLTSDNAIQWTTRDSGVTNWIYQVRHRNGIFVAVGEEGLILTSPDGETWTRRVSNSTRWLNAVDYHAGNYYAVGTGGEILRSPNAIDWTRLPSWTSKSLYGVASENGQLVAAGVEGTILRTRLLPWSFPVNFYSLNLQTNAQAFVFRGELDQRFILERSADLRFWLEGPTLEATDNTGIGLYYEGIPDGASWFYRTRLLQP